MAASTRRIEEICSENVNPGGRTKTKALIGSLRPLGFTWQRGIGERPRLLRKEVVNQVLLEEAAKARQEGRAPTTKHIPDIRSRGGPLWRHGPDVNHKGHEEQEAEGQANAGGRAEDPTGKKKSAEHRDMDRGGERHRGRGA